jgi:hypothetical protein
MTVVRLNSRPLIGAQVSEITRRNAGFSLARSIPIESRTCRLSSRPFRGPDESQSGTRSGDQGFVLDDEANAFFTTAESFDQPQAIALSSQRVDFDRSAGCFATGEDWFLGVNTKGGPTG